MLHLEPGTIKGYLKELISLYFRVSTDIENIRGYEYKVGSKKE